GLHFGAERCALDKLRHEKIAAADLTAVIDGDEVRMGKRSQQLRLALEGCRGALALRNRIQDLDSNGAAKTKLHGTEDRSHAALPDVFLELIAGDLQIEGCVVREPCHSRSP